MNQDPKESKRDLDSIKSLWNSLTEGLVDGKKITWDTVKQVEWNRNLRYIACEICEVFNINKCLLLATFGKVYSKILFFSDIYWS